MDTDAERSRASTALVPVSLPIEAADTPAEVEEATILVVPAGVKNVGTVVLAGEHEIPLKDNHAASRSRVSLMTCVVSQQGELDGFDLGLPIEILFRGSPNGRLLGTFEAPAAANVYMT